ncbi:hypothetical protein RU99_GL001576 [Enterococcus casseliflavus]|nr:hypothetical protein RU99_GL001576 [Enterococcus casseliflavus]
MPFGQRINRTFTIQREEKYSLPKEANAFGNEYFSTKFVN